MYLFVYAIYTLFKELHVVLSFGSLCLLRTNSFEISVDFLLIWHLDAINVKAFLFRAYI
jgi:hypothetical protein